MFYSVVLAGIHSTQTTFERALVYANLLWSAFHMSAVLGFFCFDMNSALSFQFKQTNSKNFELTPLNFG